MTTDEFRAAFAEADHLLPVERQNGEKGLIVGLNGDAAVLHRAPEISLDCLTVIAGVAIEHGPA